jgi:hypothetical protein
MMPVLLWFGLGLAGCVLILLHGWYNGEDTTVKTISALTIALMSGFIVFVGACIVWALDLFDYLSKKGVFDKIIIKGKK